MHVVQLMASPFFGGPERQMLGLAQALPADWRTTFVSFSESGRCRPLLQAVERCGFAGLELKHNFPDVRRAVSEIACVLRRIRADVVCCSGYKPDLFGLRAGRLSGVPVVSVSHGWTGASWKVRLYETMDRWALRWMDAIVCVSEAQARKARQAGAPAERVRVIRNAVDPAVFAVRESRFRRELESYFAAPPAHLIGAAGRFSPEKGFDTLIQAAALLMENKRDVGLVIFGDGPLRDSLEKQIADLGLAARIILPGFRTDLESFLPHFDVLALSSHTEGLPVIVLEAFAAGVPVVATAVGGVPEVVEEGVSGFLVSPGQPAALAGKLSELLADDTKRRRMGQCGRERVVQEFTFGSQSIQYQELLTRLANPPKQKAS